MSLFKKPKVVQAPDPVDPNDVANRIDQGRRRRLATGGKFSTWLAAAVADRGSAQPTTSLTGAPTPPQG